MYHLDQRISFLSVTSSKYEMVALAAAETVDHILMVPFWHVFVPRMLHSMCACFARKCNGLEVGITSAANIHGFTS